MKDRNVRTPTTISETIYKYVKKAIIDGELKPNQRIQEKEIAKIFKVSTTPVREAFQRLSAEKYLKINSRREVIVVGVTLEEIKELFEVVRVLDAFATTKTLQKITNRDIDEVKKMTKKMGAYYKNRDVHLYFRHNLKIHDKLWRGSKNKFLYQSLVSLADKCTFYANQLFFLTNNLSYLNKSYKDHLELMEAIEKKDSKEVERILISHWGKGFLNEEG